MLITDEVEQLIQEEELRTRAEAVRKLRANEKLSARERELLKKAQARQAEDRRHRDTGGFDPGEATSRINAWWVNGSGQNFQMRDGSRDWLEVPESKLHLALRRHGVPDFPVPGEAMSRLEQCVLHVMEKRTLDRAIEAIAGYRDGVHEIKNSKVLVRRGPKLIEPKQGDWGTIAELLTGRLMLEETGLQDVAQTRAQRVQIDRFNFWMARAVENIYNSPGVRLNSQVLMLAGPRESAKSRIQHMLITPLLGGRSGDPSRYVFGETTFNSGWMGCEHLLIEDPRPSMKMLDRLQFAQILKALSVNEDQSLHKKQQDEFGVNPEFVVTISINDDPDSLRILPPLTPDFADKVMLFQVHKRDLPMPTRTAAERLAFRQQIESELPAYLWFLLNECPVPADLQSDRFGVLHYHEPNLRLVLFEDTPASELLALMDSAVIETEREGGYARKTPLWMTAHGAAPEELEERFNFAAKDKPAPRLIARAQTEGRRVWCGTYQQLQSCLEACQHVRLAKKLLDHNSLQRLLSRLAEDTPERVAYYRTGGERLWLIKSPSMTEDDAGF